MTDLWEIERGLIARGIAPVCGVDEAGRGPLAGPVCAAAVILPPELEIPGLNDSKKLTDKKRRALYDIIVAEAVSYGIAMASEQEIDEINILQATFNAMERAMDQLTVRPALALIDGNRERPFPVPVQTVVKGDSLSANIAAASILVSGPYYQAQAHRQVFRQTYALSQTNTHSLSYCPFHRVFQSCAEALC